MMEKIFFITCIMGLIVSVLGVRRCTYVNYLVLQDPEPFQTKNFIMDIILCALSIGGLILRKIIF